MARRAITLASVLLILALASSSEARWSWKSLFSGMNTGPSERRILTSTCDCEGAGGITCGTDGQVYASYCDAECGDGVGAYPGECKLEECEACKFSPYSPICINGFTYPHGCYAACTGVDLGDITFGRCEERPAVDEGSDGSGSSDYDNLDLESGDNDTPIVTPGTGSGTGSGSGEVGCTCSEDYIPVCGSDGNTWWNACTAGCMDATIVHEGACEDNTGESGDYEEYELTGCDTCWDEWAPVCGTDGVTYDNECKATCNGVTKVASEGECSK